jgi:imidazole glycerol-phosphate synthase subunit HisH
MNVVIIDYGSGNLRSAAKAFERVIGETGIAAAITVSSDAAAIDAADKIVLPGVSAFGACMEGLSALPGMRDALERNVRERLKPFLGICVGMQLMAERSFEHGVHPGLGWIPGEVRPIPANGLKVPHMGWNQLAVQKSDHPVLTGIASGAHVYFVHSYAMACADAADVAARTEYGSPLVAVVARANLVGTQFHPEKSQATGLRLIGNFLAWRP